MARNAAALPMIQLGQRTLFLVWGPPSHGPRSKVLARELGIEALQYVHATARRGWVAAPYKYSYQTLATMHLLMQQRPQVVFVQTPPSPAVLIVYLYCKLTGARYVIDAHSDALQRRIWMWPRWLHRLLARNAVATIVTNEHHQAQIQRMGGQAFILRDIPTHFDANGEYPMYGNFNVVVVNTFAHDEPLTELLEAAQELPDIHFYVTGKKARARPELLACAAPNVHFTDFLPDELYYTVLSTAQAVMCLTTRDHTMQRGACEALSLGKPIITSDWPLLRTYFHSGTVHVPNTADGIRQGVRTMQEHYSQYQAEIKDLQRDQQVEWRGKVQALTDLLYKATRV